MSDYEPVTVLHNGVKMEFTPEQQARVQKAWDAWVKCRRARLAEEAQNDSEPE